MLQKQKSFAFGKDVYLLAQDNQEILYWLEEPTWDCGWYWGFGYIETYTCNKYPKKSKDITSHQHWSGFVNKKNDKTHDWIHHLNQSPELIVTVLSEKESWEISDYFKRFHALKETAEILHSGTGHLTNTAYKTKNDLMLEWINQEELPRIMAHILQILSPDFNFPLEDTISKLQKKAGKQS